ncbi:hypothetical protein EHB58_09445 [Salmonella enterica subsp. enterica serovar Hull]|uniref:Uncharacterized protein n=1 Tax=Salmonella enterica subsp. enterica serovar Hull TaxID=1403564 RepID=A0A5X4PDZ0_SALET|nr:hypothetical protein [Salmonella enterica]EBZ7585850.1 hypothetical protein [Salmonella enterica subsp. enterica serovar Hull]EBZ8648437.1 hypothetical protein [Salmonella enterica subsp. enterica serovar Hull]ECN6005583.1 hypothetical protein [Salmonella enterica subsp. enterica serovar Brandenburg]
MRYYLLTLTDPLTKKPPVDAAGRPIGPFDTSKTPGRGLHIEFDVITTGLDIVNSGTMLAIYGLPVDVLKQSVKLQGCQVSLLAGFSKGLPLANEEQRGEIIYGEVFSAYANWIGTNQSLNLIINPTVRKNADGQPLGLSVYGRKGELLGNVIARSLREIYPKKKIVCTVSEKLVLPEDCPWTYQPDVASLAMAVRSLSIALMRDNTYAGVGIVMHSDMIRIYDNTSIDWSFAKAIQPYELVGQPTWIEPFVMTFKCPLRGDIHCGDIVALPQDFMSGPTGILMTNTTPFGSMAKDNVIFSGKFLIRSVRHIGSYLVADGDAWVTIFEGIADNWKTA